MSIPQAIQYVEFSDVDVRKVPSFQNCETTITHGLADANY